MNCFMFPGQPLSHDSVLPDDRDFEEISAITLKLCGLNLSDFSRPGRTDIDHVSLQIYGTAFSLYRNRLLRRQGESPSVAAEHSMGIYPAMAACGAITEEEAIEITMRIGDCLATMREHADYALGCITGLPASPLITIADNNGVYPANFNTSRHFLISGKRWEIETAVAEALSQGAFSAKTFFCDAPLHTPLIEEVEAGLKEIVADYRFKEPSIPLMNHIDQDYLTAADIPDFLVRELCLPVYWERTYKALRAAGVNRFIEVGFGDALKKFNRWIDGES